MNEGKEGGRREGKREGGSGVIIECILKYFEDYKNERLFFSY